MIISGLARLGRDAELKATNNGDAVCNLSLAFNYGRKVEGQRPTQWVEAALWGKLAEALAPYLLKGKQVYVACSEPHIEEFTKKNGSPGFKLAARVMEIELAGNRSDSDEAPAKPAKPAPNTGPSTAELEDDVPF